MDGRQVKEWEARCVEEQPPACSAACPVHVDARGMAEAIAKGEFKAAHALFCRVIPFPAIVGRICDHPCERACRRAEAGDAIRISELERALVDAGLETPPLRAARQRDPKRIAVVGAGLSGLSAAAELGAKGHTVVVFEAETQAFGRLRRLDPQRLPAAVIDADMARLENLRIEWRLGESLVPSAIAALAEEYDAIYLGLGPAALPGLDSLLKLDDDGHIAVDPLTYATSHPKVFAGGSQRYGAKYSPITSLQDGRYAAMSIDRMLQGASLTANRDNQGSQTTLLFVNTGRHAASPAVVAADATDGYTQEEAVAEASRCFPCHCLECVKVCPYLENYGAYPKRYVREIYNNETIVMGAHKSNRMIDSCMLCGLCETVCPNNLSMGEVCLSARQGMTARGKMPPSHHEFALRDMAFSRGEAFALARHEPGRESSSLLFYPGCQLSASSPEHVERIYAHLREKVDGGVGLMLGCCGAPAHWAGRTDLFAETREGFLAEWRRLGSPPVVTACSSCYRMFADHAPEVPLQSLWPLLETIGLPAGAAPAAATLAVHDPCTARREPAIRQSLRRLAAQQGVTTQELRGGELTTCCGFGGLASFVNPDVTDRIVDRRGNESPADYLTYCAMCRDNFARRGKRALHFLDLVFPAADPAARPDPGFSARQENRSRLKRRLLRDLWRENVNEPTDDLVVDIADDVRADFERKLILAEDVRQTVRHAEASGEKLVAPGGRFVARHRPAVITYWVEYARLEGRCVVHRAYSHRMQVEAAP
jgi:Fe-S oxidoreductase